MSHCQLAAIGWQTMDGGIGSHIRISRWIPWWQNCASIFLADLPSTAWRTTWVGNWPWLVVTEHGRDVRHPASPDSEEHFETICFHFDDRGGMVPKLPWVFHGCQCSNVIIQIFFLLFFSLNRHGIPPLSDCTWDLRLNCLFRIQNPHIHRWWVPWGTSLSNGWCDWSYYNQAILGHSCLV